MIQFTTQSDDGKNFTAYGGAVFNPAAMRAVGKTPNDFNAFWRSEFSKLNTIPINAVLKEGDSGDSEINYFKVTFDNIRGTKVHGQLAFPKVSDKLPASIHFQAAGVSPLQKSRVISMARNSWLAFNILAHDLPIDESPEFYKKMAEGDLKEYTKIGWEDPQKSYFLRMLLGCYRSVDFIKSRSQWNQKTILVRGTSQGGFQSFATAAP